MTGYQEILTDPSYFQTNCHFNLSLTLVILVINPEDAVKGGVYAAGLIIRDLPLLHSNFRSNQSLSDYLKSNIVAIADIDTRRLTRSCVIKIISRLYNVAKLMKKALELALNFWLNDW